MPSPLKINLASNGLLVVCGLVVLGISAYVEHTTRKINYSSSTYTYDAFVGIFTFVALFGLVVLRAAKSKYASVGVETGISGLLWIFWLAGAADTTKYTSADRAICRHIDDLFDLPEFETADPDAIALAKKVFKSTCRDLKAQLAFLWIGFVILTVTTVYLVYLGMKRGNSMWKSSLLNYDHDAHSHSDPFADPVGSQRGPVAGVVDEDPDAKP
ncbi:hypothetical protein I302_106476 [Kwoniella bestiolae CBS 10118]|uniref:MARVEL domain-containing protein n=1 Tax=Kwoniella bestiolae CBS 10118 TaxID=1296100 RepID=A0A1B9G1B5_9TREE|nr:hypothetical protein I302_06267 [Kwoniella bestiolae CBS 10118]OCF24806.1 hypothetical protein I302_06267 [Kwoniella bestiolae CBS 10118]